MGKGNEKKKFYLLLDSGGTVLARGSLESPPDFYNVQIRVTDGKVMEVMEHEDLQLIALEEDAQNLIGRIIGRRGDVIVLEKLKNLGAEARQNLRMPVTFDSFIYPLTGAWTGRRRVRANDLSCGGISFFCDEPLENGEQMEVVIPVTNQPLVLRCKILRRRLSGGTGTLYAAEFADTCDDEERLVREAVFSIQIKSHASGRLAEK